MPWIIFIIFAFLILACVLAVFSFLIYFIYKWLVKKGYKWGGIIMVLSLITFLLYNIYIAFYPLDSFYINDFKSVTSREIPKSAVIISKTASYPDIHGKYISCSLVKLSKEDYAKLLDELTNDKNMSKNAETIYSEEFNQIMQSKSPNDIKFSFARKVNGRPDNLSYVGFFNDQQTIIIWFFKTSHSTAQE